MPHILPYCSKGGALFILPMNLCFHDFEPIGNEIEIDATFPGPLMPPIVLIQNYFHDLSLVLTHSTTT